MNKSFILVIFLLITNSLKSQDILANVVVNSDLISQTNKSIFNNLQKEISNLINTRSWSGKNLANNEKLKINLLINVLSFSENKFLANFEFQSMRPVLNSTFQTPVFNYVDTNFEFTFEEYQTLYFVENKFESNLVSSISFFMFVISGLDNDSFILNSGDKFYDKAQEIMNLASQSISPRSWQPSSNNGRLNKFWLIENLNSQNAAEFKDLLYNYHANGMDIMSKNIIEAKTNISSSIVSLELMNRRTPNSILIRIFFETKSSEIQEIFSSGPQFDTSLLYNQLNRLAPFFSNKWSSIRN
tara:strand:- start:170 stop:1069 length:900 start_codon:yes stop_codon:yes gene_type:complete